MSCPLTMLISRRPPLRWSSVAAALAKCAGVQYPGRIAASGRNVVVRAAIAVATVNVSGRPQPVPISAPDQPCSSAVRARSTLWSRVPYPLTVSSPRWPGSTVFGMYHRKVWVMPRSYGVGPGR
nr:hypothetical protein GCM10020092_040430 [Actinoplanes digitatis]